MRSRKDKTRLSGHSHHNHLYLDVTCTNPHGVTNQEFINRAALGRQTRPGPGEHDPGKRRLAGAVRAEDLNIAQIYDAIRSAIRGCLSCLLSHSRRRRARGLVPYRVGGEYLLSAKQLRDSAPPADVLVGKANQDTARSLRRGPPPRPKRLTTIQLATWPALDGYASAGARARPSRTRSSLPFQRRAPPRKVKLPSGMLAAAAESG